ncbi:MAG: FAD-binding protein, partial [Acidimicrobiia bacterium]|nr:FAD-binding protein [Acidimicrobiia bacterium]
MPVALRDVRSLALHDRGGHAPRRHLRADCRRLPRHRGRRPAARRDQAVQRGQLLRPARGARGRLRAHRPAPGPLRARDRRVPSRAGRRARRSVPCGPQGTGARSGHGTRDRAPARARAAPQANGRGVIQARGRLAGRPRHRAARVPADRAALRARGRAGRVAGPLRRRRARVRRLHHLAHPDARRQRHDGGARARGTVHAAVARGRRPQHRGRPGAGRRARPRAARSLERGVIDVEVLVVGSGFSGSIAALGLLRQGLRVALVERGRHPRFAIGESSTPLANLLLEEIADRYELAWLRSFSKWGTWQRDHPGVACGLKRGFTFYFHAPGEPFVDDERHERQLLVGASPRDEIGDTHWYRPDFDHALAQAAERAGAIFLDETRIESLTWHGGRASVHAVRHGAGVGIDAGFVVDASGPRGFLHRTLPLAEAPTRWLPPTEALYTHFEDVQRWDRDGEPPEGRPPYPPDDAAMHHVFPGGWIWVLRFNNGITSAGAAVTAPAAARLRLADG